MVRALALQLNGREFDRFPAAAANTRWVTVFGRANQLGILPSHLCLLSFPPYAGREMSTGQSAVMLCGLRVAYRMAHSIWISVWVAGKAV